MLQYFTQANEYYSVHIDKLIVITFYKSKVFFCKYEVGGKNTLPHFIN